MVVCTGFDSRLTTEDIFIHNVHFDISVTSAPSVGWLVNRGATKAEYVRKMML